MTSLPLARVFQSLFTFALVSASRWLVKIWQLSRKGATGELEVEYSNSREVVASSRRSNFGKFTITFLILTLSWRSRHRCYCSILSGLWHSTEVPWEQYIFYLLLKFIDLPCGPSMPSLPSSPFVPASTVVLNPSFHFGAEKILYFHTLLLTTARIFLFPWFHRYERYPVKV